MKKSFFFPPLLVPPSLTPLSPPSARLWNSRTFRHGGGLSAQTILGVRLTRRTAPSVHKAGTRETPAMLPSGKVLPAQSLEPRILVKLFY